jgi:toxin CcdB
VTPLQFDVFVNPSTRGTEGRPYVVVVQANILKASSQRLVVPLVVEHEIKPMGRLNPGFEIEGRRVYLQPLEMAAFPARSLQRHVANLEEFRYQIIGAIDLVLTGV